MIRLTGLSGSLRQDSFNTRLLKAMATMAPDDVDISVDTIAGIPLYNGDDEGQHGIPEAVELLKSRIVETDGLIVSTPEYNNAMPGVLKNAVDWLSRPPSDIRRVFHNLPLAVIGATQGAFGTTLSQVSWLPVWRLLGVNLFTTERLMVSAANNLFDDDGSIIDEGVEQRIHTFIEKFAVFVADHRRP